MEYGPVRFAAPADWSAPTQRCWSYPPASATGAILAGSTQIAHDLPCPPTASPLPASVLMIDGGHDAVPPGTPTGRLGTVSVSVLPARDCHGCSAIYQVDDGYQISAAGPLAAEVLATVTTSGRDQAAAAGPLTDTAGWHTINYSGVSFEVPDNWPTIDLPSARQRPLPPAGTDQARTFGPPVDCGAAMFRPDPGQPPPVYEGRATVYPMCPQLAALDLSVGDGVWVQPAPTGGPPDSVVPQAPRIDRVTNPTAVIPPVVELVVHTDNGDTQLFVGAGTDPELARTIINTIHTS
jgi:hypothetical protein